MTENNTGNPMFVLGQEYLLDFTQLLSVEIEKYLLGKWGEDWFEGCVVKESNISSESMNDLSFLMRQILDLNNHNFRVAIAMSFFGNMQMEKPHLTALEMIRKSRNFWAHPNRLIKLHDLNKLAFNIRALIPASEPLAEKCAVLLSTEERGDHLSVIASMTEINRIYRNTAEYRNEMAKSLSEFSRQIKELGENKEIDPLFVAQNHMLRNLWANFLLVQPMYYAMQLDCLSEKRDAMTGYKTFSNKNILELNRNLDTEGGLRLASDYADALMSVIGSANCDCEFCQTIGGTGPVFFSEDSQKRVDDVHLAMHEDKDLSVFFENEDFGGTRPPYYWFLIVMCVAKGRIPTEEVMKWNFDVLNPSLEMGSEAFENHDVLIATIKLLAIRNGIPSEVVDRWDLEE
jgi:hypothetical protein